MTRATVDRENAGRVPAFFCPKIGREKLEPGPGLSYRRTMRPVHAALLRAALAQQSLPWMLVAGICCVLSGCVDPVRTPPAPETQVAYKTLEAPDTPRYELRDEEGSNVPVQTVTTPPEYPPAMIVRHLAHVGVHAKVIVDTEGTVSEVRIDHAANAETYPAEFDDAVRSAAAHWRYAPLRIQQWEDVLDSEGNVTDSRLIEDETKPFSLDYEFSFDLRDGKPVVASNQARAK